MSKARLSADVRVDLSRLQARFSKDELAKKQEKFAKRVAFETRDYVPVDEGTLRGSEELASDYASGEIEWQTPYAQRVYDLPQSSIRTTVNPKAKSAWAAAAKRDRMDAWEDYAHELMEER